MARILVVDDHQLTRRHVKSLLVQNAIAVCGEAGDGRQAVEKVKELRPDLVLLDIHMPVMNGIEAAYEIHQIAPSTKILFLSINGSPEAQAASRLLRADGFVPKVSAGTDLIPALKRIFPEP